MSSSSVGLLVIATGRYLDFAKTLIGDVGRTLPASCRCVVNLFTDAPPDATRAMATAFDTPVRVHPVPALRWPEASLLRFDLFRRAADALEGDTLVYLDADLRVRQDFTPLLRPQEWPGRMAAVRHPGFYRPHAIRPRGTWETRRESRAYVPLWRRRHYVCGGVWMGERSALIATSDLLADRVSADTESGVIARWHDESHWNWWVAHRPVELLDPSWCHVPDYPWLGGLTPIIEAVDKGARFEREETSVEVREALTRAEGSPDAGG